MTCIKQKLQESPELLLQLKYVGTSVDSTQESCIAWNQLDKTLSVLFMNNTDIAKKKRKLADFLQETPTATYGVLQKKPNARNHTLRYSSRNPMFTLQSSSELRNRADSQKYSKQILQDLCSSIGSLKSDSSLSQHDALERRSVLGQEVLPTHHSDNDSTYFSKEQNFLSQTSDESIITLESGCNLLTKQVTETTLQDDPVNSNRTPDENLLPILILDESVERKEIPSSRNVSPRRSNRLKDFVGDHLQESIIPVGDRFQASIPEWTGPPSYDYYNLESSKWLGERVWPIEDGKAKNTKMEMMIGKGRSDTLCSCEHPDSAECIKCHVEEKRSNLLLEIGDAFYRWGFDEMGEVVSKLWTLKEQNNFKDVFKIKTTLSRKSFWKRVFKRLPCKCRENIVSYYYNVYTLRNVGRQTRMLSTVIDSDDDEFSNNVQRYKTSKKTFLRRII